MSRDNNRLLLELEQYRRETNREKIDPLLSPVDVKTLDPIVRTCANARAAYISCLISIATDSEESTPSAKQIEQLKMHRITYEELVSAANALETVIARGYVAAKES